MARARRESKGQARELVNPGVISVKKGDFPTVRRLYDESLLGTTRRAANKSGMAAVMGDTGILLRAKGKLQDARY